MKSYLYILGFTVLLASTAQARFSSVSVMNGVWLGMDATYLNDKIERTAANSTTNAYSTYSVYDVRLDYITIDQLYFGAVYSMMSSSASGITAVNGSAAGVSIGYITVDGFDFGGSYFVTANRGDYKEGSGYQANIGWKAEVGRGFYLGAKVVYREITYKKNETIALFTSEKRTETMPFITLGFLF